MATILVVDDRPINREFLVTLLGYLDHALLQAADGAEALALALAHHPDLVITDVLMPVMDGVEFVRRLHADPAIAGIPVIFYTATYRLGDAWHLARSCGVDTVIGKPASPQAILAAVAAKLGGPSELPPAGGAPCQSESGLSFWMGTLPPFQQQARAEPPATAGREPSALEQSLSATTTLSLRLAALLELGLELNSAHDADLFLESFIRAARDIMNAQYAAAGLVDRNGRLAHVATHGLPDEMRQRLADASSSGLFGRLLADGEVQRLANAANQPDDLPGGHPPVHGLLALPVRSPTQRYGWLYFANKLGTAAFSDEDEQIAGILASKLALACANLLQLEELQSYAGELEIEVAARRKSEERLHLAQQVARIGTFEWNIVDNTVQVSGELATLYGLPPAQDFVEPHAAWCARIHPEERPAIAQQIQECLCTGQRFEAEWRVVWPDGALRWLAGRAEIYRDAAGQPQRMLGVNIDITARKESEERVRRVAQHDPLTGLPNRALVYEFAEHLLPAMRRSQGQAAFLFIDLDRFKPINDIHGHEVGDAVLKEVARRLTVCVRAEDLVGRLGGDEFVAVLARIHGGDDAARVAFHVIECLGQPYLLNDLELHVSPSIGISLFPQDGGAVDELIKRADTAMYTAKQGGRNNFRFFQHELNARSDEALHIESRLRKALEGSEFALHLQPVIELETGRIVAAEALIRWPALAVPPERFIPVAEMAGFMQSLGPWILQEACRLLRHWRAQGIAGFPVSVNVSPIQFRQRDFRQNLVRVIEQAGLQAGDLYLEITENMLINNIDEAVGTLRALRDMGVKVALDDFGTGFSSLSYLTRLPLDIVKLDQSFVRNLGRDRRSAVVAESIITLAMSLGMAVVAEGIESKQALAFLKARHCQHGQGFLFSRPLPAPEFEQWCRQHVP